MSANAHNGFKYVSFKAFRFCCISRAWHINLGWSYFGSETKGLDTNSKFEIVTSVRLASANILNDS